MFLRGDSVVLSKSSSPNHHHAGGSGAGVERAGVGMVLTSSSPA